MKILFLFLLLLLLPQKAFASDYTYTNQEQDKSGLLHYDSRYYDPDLGRFLQPDSYDVPNKYAYVSNDPVNRIDPSGHMEVSVPAVDYYNEHPRAFGGIDPANTDTYSNIFSDPIIAKDGSNLYFGPESFTAMFWPVMGKKEFKYIESLGTNVPMLVFENPYGLALSNSQVSSFKNLLPPEYIADIKNKIPNSSGLRDAFIYYVAVLLHLGSVSQHYSIGIANGDSMWPSTPKGMSLFLEYKLSPSDNLQVGDVVSFWNRAPGWNSMYESGYVSHRIVDIAGSDRYILRGDNLDIIGKNQTEMARRKDIYGKALLNLDITNYQGYPIPFPPPR